MTTKTRTFRDWLTSTLDAGQIAELAEYGADAGWPGLTYTSDCAAGWMAPYRSLLSEPDVRLVTRTDP